MMNSAELTVLRGQLMAVERGFLVGLYGPDDVREAVARMEQKFPDMPQEERSRVGVLKMTLSSEGDGSESLAS
jgi:hypothetical protein